MRAFLSSYFIVFEIGFVHRWRGVRQLPLLIFKPQSLAASSLISKRRPGRLRPAATLAHMGESCRFSLVTRLCGASEEEIEI